MLDTGEQQRLHRAEERERRDLPGTRVRGHCDQVRVLGHLTGQVAVQRRTPKLLRIGECRTHRIDTLHTTSIVPHAVLTWPSLRGPQSSLIAG